MIEGRPLPSFRSAAALNPQHFAPRLRSGSIYASLTSQIRGLIGAREIAAMQRHAVLVNIARGEVIDEAALTAALVEGCIAGAALDLFAVEPLTDGRLFGLDNVILTSHQAGLTHNAKSGAAVGAVRNSLAVLSGQVPPNLVNRPNPRGDQK